MEKDRSSQMVRLNKDVLAVARSISKETGVPVSRLIEDACREAFRWYLKGAQGVLKIMGEK
jgi:Ribbon-helix-helix domain